MKKLNIFLVPLLFSLLVFMGCEIDKSNTSTRVTTATISLTGKAGTPFTGFYVQYGKRVAVASVLPWKFQGDGVTEFEFRRASPGDPIAYEIVRDGGIGGHSAQAGSIGLGVLGVHGEIRYRSMKAWLVFHD